MALKQTEDQVKQMRDEITPQNTTHSRSVRSKLTSKVRTPQASAAQGMSDQDIKAALGLVDESWARQEYRLQQYLARNCSIAQGIPTRLEVDEEEFERPDTAGSLGRILERVRFETTPTVEKEVELGFGVGTGEEEYDDATPVEKDLEMALGRRGVGKAM